MIVSTTLCKNNEAIIQDALRSVLGHVDACVLIDTGCSDATVEKAREVAGDKLIVREWTWKNDFAAARNYSLKVAEECGATWAVTLDSDERIHWNGVDLHQVLDPEMVVYSMYQRDGTYEKPRIIQIGKNASWEGATHEYLNSRGRAITLKGAVFSELGKSIQDSKHKFERDIEILIDQIRKDPNNSRWHFYLGDSYRNSGRLEEAAQAYEACAACKGWDEEAAWACYRAAEIRGNQGDRLRAVELCAQGLGLHPGIAELAWLAGFHSFYMGRMHHAVHWSRLAVSMGMYQGHFKDVVRIGFRDMGPLWEKPFDVLRFALRNLGHIEAADDAEKHWKISQKMREEQFSGR